MNYEKEPHVTFVPFKLPSGQLRAKSASIDPTGKRVTLSLEVESTTMYTVISTFDSSVGIQFPEKVDVEETVNETGVQQRFFSLGTKSKMEHQVSLSSLIAICRKWEAQGILPQELENTLLQPELLYFIAGCTFPLYSLRIDPTDLLSDGPSQLKLHTRPLPKHTHNSASISTLSTSKSQHQQDAFLQPDLVENTSCSFQAPSSDEDDNEGSDQEHQTQTTTTSTSHSDASQP